MAYYLAQNKFDRMILDAFVPADTEIIVQYSNDPDDHVFGDYYKVVCYKNGNYWFKPVSDTVIEIDFLKNMEEVFELPEIIPLAITSARSSEGNAPEPLRSLRF